MQALGALRAARERGLTVPRDISVVGLDDLYLSSYTDPPLTTVQQPKQEMGRLAAQMLLELISGKSPASRLTITGKLVVRASTAAPRAAAGH
jgi:LacI family transcriptional regulator